MSDITELRQRVEAAEQSFGLIGERERKYSERLIHLIGSIERELQEHREALAWRDSRLVTLERENGELRTMMHSLLQAIEDGGQDRIGAVVSDLDQRVTSLLSASEAPTAQPAQADDPEPEEEEPEPDPVSPEDEADFLEILEDDCTTEAVDDAPQEAGPEEELEDDDGNDDDQSEVVARLLAGDGEPDSSVRDIIDRVTKLAETLAPAGQALLNQSAAEPAPSEAMEEIDSTEDPAAESDGSIEICESDANAVA